MFRKILIVLLVLVLLGGVFAYIFYTKIFNPNVKGDIGSGEIYIPTDSDYNDVLDTLISKKMLTNNSSFDWVARQMKFDQNPIKPGRYIIQPGWSNRQLVNHLRLGRQVPLNLVLNNVRTIDELFEEVSKYLEPTKEAFLDYYLNNEFLEEVGYSKETLLTHFIPNTYQVFWNSTPRSFFDRLDKEQNKYWSENNRLKKIQNNELTKSQAYTLASIVEKESNNASEKPRIAGVYLNRILRGIKLQADPTVVFAVGDFGIKRVLNKHLEYPSPYNTYLNKGLPPGPICMPSLSSLNAVINVEDHDYIFFCAKPGYQGEHLFAKDLTEHNRNARKFHQWLDKEGIR